MLKSPNLQIVKGKDTKMKKKNDRKYGMVLAVIGFVILMIVACVFIEKGNDKVREEAKAIADRFSDAYFSGNIDGVKAYLAESFAGDLECYHPHEGESAEVEIIQVKGLQNINIFNMRNPCHFSVEFRAVYEDSLTYLETDVVREKSGWKIKSYGLEK